MTERTKAIVRMVALAVLSLNAVLTAKGISPLDNSELTEVLSYAAAAVMAGWAAWKNNNITDAAAEAQEFLNALKAMTPEMHAELQGNKGDDEIE